MSIWAAKLEKPWQKDVKPGTEAKWAAAAPVVAKEAVSAATGSRTAGEAARLATAAALESSSRLKEEVGGVIRDAAYETGTTIVAAVAGPFILAGVLIAMAYDALTGDPKSKSLQGD